MNKGALAAILIVIIVVATVVPLFAFNIISLGPKTNPSPSPSSSASVSPTSTSGPSTSPTTSPSSSATPLPSGSPSTQTYGILNGIANDTNGNPLAAVKVTIGGKTGETNSQGWFSVSNIVPGNKQVAKFSKPGYTTTYQIADIISGEISFAAAMLKPIEKTQTFSATQGATITNPSGNSYVTIDPNSLSTHLGALFSGMVTASMTTFDPTDANDANAFPGEYLGQTTNGTVEPIKSFGFVDISFADADGEDLQLASGKTAMVSVGVPYDLQSEAANMGTCPMWYFDTSAGIWKEEGTGTYNSSSDSFTGTVTHFTTWNFDVAYPRAYISGRVVDSNGNPIWGAQVKCWGTGWNNQRWRSGETVTNDNGAFIKIPVETGVTFKYQASKGGHNSIVLEAGPLVANQEYNVGDIVLDAPLVTITLKWGLNPDDLDSHLTANLTSGTSFHVYWLDEGSLARAPYANLDTDETNSYGPEVISISKLQAGTYRYSVVHYSGDGTIATSGAEVNLAIPSLGIYRYTPPSNQPVDTDIWRVFDLVVDNTGRVTAVNSINDYFQTTSGNDSPRLYP
jgi:uncharacterized protein YfaP (DUF2135 family)